MDNVMGIVRQIEPTVALATGGVILAVGSLAYGWWNERKQRQMGEEMVAMHKRLYSMQAIRGSMGRLIKETVEELVHTKTMTQDDADKVCQALAFKLGSWELHPKPKPQPVPDPIAVKTAIRIRLNGRHPVRMPFPDLAFPRAPSLAEELRVLLTQAR